ncbi:hypothetical protein ASF69_01560 [Rhizobium sp. Leaf311]|uniref:hypothetical protein n=1 Tax=Rhizobium sp. Leaf311 TaxID=1736332 RepID=UPI0007147738|nr:hypothetical protein [Rhizobium sp. Leaf311]KQQ61137.1 hypothetical protein ASF69_01560 [Rhizobium sp. Leaf311]
MTRPPPKYFGLSSSTDLYLKLLYDIERLRSAVSIKAVQYAAFDAAVTASHILDWVLAELKPEAHLRLTGLRKKQKVKCEEGDQRKENPITNFIERNRDQLPDIDYCRQISNAVKHMKMSLGTPMKGMGIGSTAKFKYTGKEMTGVHIIAYIQIKPGAEKRDAVGLFEASAEQWRQFLVRERLWVEQPPEREDEA